MAGDAAANANIMAGRTRPRDFLFAPIAVPEYSMVFFCLGQALFFGGVFKELVGTTGGCSTISSVCGFQ